MKIFLDPGHGGADPGAVGPTGLRESLVALQIAERATRLLISAGHQVELSRDFDDQTIDLGERARQANAWKADVFISIHCNAATSRDARGIEAWTTRGQTESDKIATAILAAVGRAFPSEPIRKDLIDGDSDKEAGFKVLTATRAPAVLVEVGFISHPETEAAMRSPSWISAAAAGICTGIANWSTSTTIGAPT